MFAPFFVESRVIRRAFLVLGGMVFELGSAFLETGAVLTVIILSVIGAGGIRALYRERPGVPGIVDRCANVRIAPEQYRFLEPLSPV